MKIKAKSKESLNTIFDGSIDRIDVNNVASIEILASTPRGKTIKLCIEEWEVSELVKQLRVKGFI